jgi:hypothetical protein
MCDSSTVQELKTLSNKYTDVQCFITARAAKQHCLKYYDADANCVIRVLVPRYLTPRDRDMADQKMHSSSFKFVVPDGTGFAFRSHQS